MLKKLILFGVSFFCIALLEGQQIENIQITQKSSYGQKKLKKSPKKVFISEFRVFFQMLYRDAEQTREGVYHGSTKTTVTVGLKGVSKNNLMNASNKIYQNYIKNLRAEGFEIVSIDEAGEKVKLYRDWERKVGGSLSRSQIPGYVMVVPEGFEYYVKGTKKSGKQKSTFTDRNYKVSYDLGKVNVISVNIVIPFISDAESGGSKLLTKAIGGISKIVVKSNLRLGNNVIGAYSNIASTSAEYVFTENKVSSDCFFTTKLKEPVSIPEVLDDHKIKSVAGAKEKTMTQMGALAIVYDNDVINDEFQILECDGADYEDGVVQASNAFLDESLKLFFAYQRGDKPSRK